MTKLDEIGFWSEIKLEIVSKYAKAYSTILAKQPRFRHVYIDAFSGAGIHMSKEDGALIPGSPLNALRVEPPFAHHYFIDLASDKVEFLREWVGERQDIDIYEGDCNSVLLEKVYPNIRYQDWKRALCLLDPYGLHLKWDVIYTAGHLKTIDMFLNFPVLDMQRNVLWKNPDMVKKSQLERMNAFWGDDSWKEYAYYETENLFGEKILSKGKIGPVVAAFRERLRNVAGFKFVPAPLPMRGESTQPYYYLYFASHNETGAKIAGEIFSKYRN
ncbi:MAG: three-Cys-motif partner protein TcmP [Candidatus Zixiibacteriota bacterium]|nr:MAG: three-Cys-motif partner protein TcmP [candidate division Zixibacteria bacterium]